MRDFINSENKALIITKLTAKLLISLGIIIGTVSGGIFWMQSTFAEATEMVEVRASIAQMQIDSARKELRGLKRDLRSSRNSDKTAILNDMDAVKDALSKYQEKRGAILNGY